jgi:hypothetical protein
VEGKRHQGQEHGDEDAHKPSCSAGHVDVLDLD